MDVVAKKKTKNNSNSSEKSLKSLRDRYAKNKPRDTVEIPIEAVNLELHHYVELLEPVSNWLLSEKVVIYDTESDGVVASNTLEKTREYHFYDCSAKAHLNIRGRRFFL
jgi:hypothetical protein